MCFWSLLARTDRQTHWKGSLVWPRDLLSWASGPRGCERCAEEGRPEPTHMWSTTRSLPDGRGMKGAHCTLFLWLAPQPERELLTHVTCNMGLLQASYSCNPIAITEVFLQLWLQQILWYVLCRLSMESLYHVGTSQIQPLGTPWSFHAWVPHNCKTFSLCTG